jgi:hypothetical protein
VTPFEWGWTAVLLGLGVGLHGLLSSWRRLLEREFVELRLSVLPSLERPTELEAHARYHGDWLGDLGFEAHSWLQVDRTDGSMVGFLFRRSGTWALLLPSPSPQPFLPFELTLLSFGSGRWWATRHGPPRPEPSDVAACPAATGREAVAAHERRLPVPAEPSSEADLRAAAAQRLVATAGPTAGRSATAIVRLSAAPAAAWALRGPVDAWRGWRFRRARERAIAAGREPAPPEVEWPLQVAWSAASGPARPSREWLPVSASLVLWLATVVGLSAVGQPRVAAAVSAVGAGVLLSRAGLAGARWLARRTLGSRRTRWRWFPFLGPQLERPTDHASAHSVVLEAGVGWLAIAAGGAAVLAAATVGSGPTALVRLALVAVAWALLDAAPLPGTSGRSVVECLTAGMDRWSARLGLVWVAIPFLVLAAAWRDPLPLAGLVAVLPAWGILRHHSEAGILPTDLEDPSARARAAVRAVAEAHPQLRWDQRWPLIRRSLARYAVRPPAPGLAAGYGAGYAGLVMVLFTIVIGLAAAPATRPSYRTVAETEAPDGGETWDRVRRDAGFESGRLVRGGAAPTSPRGWTNGEWTWLEGEDAGEKASGAVAELRAEGTGTLRVCCRRPRPERERELRVALGPAAPWIRVGPWDGAFRRDRSAVHARRTVDRLAQRWQMPSEPSLARRLLRRAIPDRPRSSDAERQALRATEAYATANPELHVEATRLWLRHWRDVVAGRSHGDRLDPLRELYEDPAFDVASWSGSWVDTPDGGCVEPRRPQRAPSPSVLAYLGRACRSIRFEVRER